MRFEAGYPQFEGTTIRRSPSGGYPQAGADRLIARKEFKPLTALDANLLAQRLGIKHHFTKPATLSEIYALRKNSSTLIHDVKPDDDASGIIDDL